MSWTELYIQDLTDMEEEIKQEMKDMMKILSNSYKSRVSEQAEKPQYLTHITHK